MLTIFSPLSRRIAPRAGCARLALWTSRTAGASAALTILALPAPAPAGVYQVVPIPTFGGANSYGHGINDSGQVVGYAQNELGQNRAFIFNAGTINDLGTLGGAEGQAFAINNTGQVAGFSRTTGGLEHAFRYADGTMTDLGTLGGSSSYAFAINASGQVTGGSTKLSDSGYRAFRYTAPTMQDLGTLGGNFGSSEGAGIDDDGSVVGYTSLTSFASQAFVHRNGIMQLLGTLGGNYSYAQAIKNGVIVGGAFEAGDSAFRAARWADGTVTSLGVLPGLPSSIAYGLNAAGQIVGKSDAGTSPSERAFLHLGGTMLDLNDLIPAGSGWTLRQARGINASGQIVGFGTFDGQTRGFRLDLVGRIWTSPAGGSWNAPERWFSPGVPAEGQAVAFPLAAAYTVTVDSNASAGTMNVSRGALTLSLSPGSALTIGSAVSVRGGASLTATGPGTLNGGGLQVADGGTFTASGAVTNWASLDSGGTVRAAAGGVVRLIGPGPTGMTAALTVDGAPGAWTGRVDIGGRAVVIDYSPGVGGGSPLATVADQVRTARGAGGAWDGNGITSSSANATGLAVGFAEAAALYSQFPANFSGRSVDSSAVLLRLTRYGDANLDGAVGLGDFSLLASNFNAAGPWSSGDFNYDGTIGIADFSVLAVNFNTSMSGDASARSAAAVPEPGAGAAVVGLWAAGTLASRRRRNREAGR